MSVTYGSTGPHEKPNVNTPSPRFVELEELREPCRDLMLGLPRIKEQRAKYNQRNPAEKPVRVTGVGMVDPYEVRINNSQLDSILSDAVGDAVGRIFAKAPEPTEDTPPRLVEFLDDVDLRGSNILVFATQSAATAVSEGNDFVLVDFPRVGDGLTRSVDDERRLGLRPFWRRYSPGSVIDWEHREYRGMQRLVMVRLREKVWERDGEWGKKAVDQVRVIYAGNPDSVDPAGRFVSFDVYRQNEKNEWQKVSALSGEMRPQVDIPLIELPTDSVAPFEAIPPFLDLAWLNLAIYRKTSILDNGQLTVGFPFLHWSGAETDSEGNIVGLAENRMLISRDPASKASFVEPEGKAWAAVEARIKSMQEQAARMSDEVLLSQEPGTLTATGEAIRAARATSRLGSWALNFQDAYSRLLYHTAIFMGLVKPGADAGWGGLEINDEFLPTNQNVENVREAREWVMMGLLSHETAHEVAMRAKFIPETVPFEEEQARLRRQGPISSPGGEDDPEDEPGDEGAEDAA